MTPEALRALTRWDLGHFALKNGRIVHGLYCGKLHFPENANAYNYILTFDGQFIPVSSAAVFAPMDKLPEAARDFLTVIRDEVKPCGDNCIEVNPEVSEMWGTQMFVLKSILDENSQESGGKIYLDTAEFTNYIRNKITPIVQRNNTAKALPEWKTQVCIYHPQSHKVNAGAKQKNGIFVTEHILMTGMIRQEVCAECADTEVKSHVIAARYTDPQRRTVKDYAQYNCKASYTADGGVRVSGKYSFDIIWEGQDVIRRGVWDKSENRCYRSRFIGIWTPLTALTRKTDGRFTKQQADIICQLFSNLFKKQ